MVSGASFMAVGPPKNGMKPNQPQSTRFNLLGNMVDMFFFAKKHDQCYCSPATQLYQNSPAAREQSATGRTFKQPRLEHCGRRGGSCADSETKTVVSESQRVSESVLGRGGFYGD